MNLKKKLMVLIAAGIMMFSIAPMALAEPETDEGQSDAQVTETAAPVQQPIQTQTAQTTEFTNSKYLTKGGAAIWFILILLANGAFSFWVGNRFYRLAKKDNHVSAEIRALRRDIDDKFVKSVDGIAEQEIDIENLNESLGINIIAAEKTKKNTVKELSPEEEERFRRWEEAQSKPKTERARTARPTIREELEEDFDDVKTPSKKDYKPRREEPVSAENKSDDLGETKVIKPMGESVKNKAKEILGDIFPFKDE